MEYKKLLQNSGWYILSALSIIPLVLWFLGSNLTYKFSNLSFLTKSIGDIAGLCGMAMFALVIILSARLKFFERFFKGINQLYVIHHILGAIAFCLLLFHPLFLAYNYFQVSISSAAMFFLPSLDTLAKNDGGIALFLMIITLVITFYTNLKYRVWRFTHKFLGLAFIFAFLHTMFIGADVASNIYLKIYFLILGCLAIASFFYRSIFAKYFVKTYKYTVENIVKYPDKNWEVTFKPVNKVINFIPGQFGFFKLFNNQLSKELHPFSFSSATGDTLKIVIKELGDYTNKISSLKVGDLAEIEAPFGVFNYKNYGQSQIWIAGGVGITPFLSMARSLTEQDKNYKIDLFYCVKDDNCNAFLNEFLEISSKYPNLSLKFWITDKDGFINVNSIKDRNPDIHNRDILMCGPSPMVNSLKNQFIQQGVKMNRLHIEEFMLY